MPNYNKVVLVGHLGSDPEVKVVRDGISVCNVSIATKEKYEGKEETTWVSLTFFNRLAETVAQYARKGSAVMVEGKLKYTEWVDSEERKRGKHYVKVVWFNVLDSKRDDRHWDDNQPQNNDNRNPAKYSNNPSKQYNNPMTDDDIPF